LISSNKLLPALVWLAQNTQSDSWWPRDFRHLLNVLWAFTELRKCRQKKLQKKYDI
jgi:hypothetical protein